MLTTADFLQATKWSGITTLVFGGLMGLGFLFKWGIRFRLVGVTGFMCVLTAGLFSLSLVPFAPTVVPGSVHYKVVYDNGANQVAIVVPADITESELDATLRQAAINQFSVGRMARGKNLLTIRARTVLHPEPGISQPLYLGQVKRSVSNREDDPLEIEIDRDKLAQLPASES